MTIVLFEEHKAMIEAGESFLAALKSTPRPSIEEVSRQRVKLSSLIRRHRLTEEEHIFTPLREGSGRDEFSALEPLVASLMREKVKYSEHVRKWTPQAIQADWNGYVAAVEMRIEGVKRVIREEEESVYAVVLGLDRSGSSSARGYPFQT